MARQVQGPLQACTAMVVNRHAVPVIQKSFILPDGEWHDFDMVDITSTQHHLDQWLLRPARMTRARYLSLPLVKEMQDVVRSTRAACKKRGGRWVAQDGAALSEAIESEIRGMPLVLHNVSRCTMVNLGDSVQLMQWLLNEVHKDNPTACG